MKTIKEKIFSSLISSLLRFFISLIGNTCRVQITSGQKVIEEILKEKKPVIFSFWHNRIFFLSHFLHTRIHKKKLKLTVLISASKDGELIAKVVESWGGVAVRGSSSRQGVSALKSLYKIIKKGNHAVVTTPDGPRGPKYQFQFGTLFLSSVTKIPVIPISCTFKNAWVFNSWDKFMVPKPFSRVSVHIGKPVFITEELNQETLSRYASVLTNTLMEMSDQ